MIDKYKNVVEDSATRFLDQGILSCQEDACLVDKELPKLLGFGKSGKIIVLGIAPSCIRRKEEKTQYAMSPFSLVNTPGYLLWKVLDEVSFPVADIYITNLMKCSTPKNRLPTEQELDTCFNSWLSQEIAICNPEIIICLGKLAFDSIAKLNVLDGVKIVQVYHHSFIVRDLSKFEEWRQQWNLIKNGL